MYTFDNPRLTCRLPIAAAGRTSLRDFILTKLATAAAIEALFVDRTVADEAARLGINESPGYVVWQTDVTTAYLIIDGDGTAAEDWLALDLTSVPAYVDFINNISWRIRTDSLIGNAGAGDLVIMNNFIESGSPSVAAFGTYGVSIAAAASRAVSGHASNYYVYSAAGTTVLLDLSFDVG